MNSNNLDLEAFNIVFIKRFRFPEPVFDPKNLKGAGIQGKLSRYLKNDNDVSFLSNPDKIYKKILNNDMCYLKNGLLLKPIKNYRSSKDNFWRPFNNNNKYKTINISEKDELQLYPFQIVLDDCYKIDCQKFEHFLNSKLLDYKISAQIRIYPPGVGTIQLYFYLKPEKIDLTHINQLFNPKNVLMEHKGKKYNVSQLFEKITRNVLKNLLIESSLDRIENGIYTVINFQGNDISLDENLEQISMILTGKSNPSKGKIKNEENKLLKRKLNGKHEEDIIIVSKRVGIIYLDKGLKKDRTKLLRARRCFRNHFIDAIELAFVTEFLINEYSRYFEDILHRIDTAEIDNTTKGYVKKILTNNILNSCAYSTLLLSILPIEDNLNQIPWTKDVYKQAFKEFNIEQQISNNLKITDELRNKAKEWEGMSQKIDCAYEEIKYWVERAEAFVPLSGISPKN